MPHERVPQLPERHHGDLQKSVIDVGPSAHLGPDVLRQCGVLHDTENGDGKDEAESWLGLDNALRKATRSVEVVQPGAASRE